MRTTSLYALLALLAGLETPTHGFSLPFSYCKKVLVAAGMGLSLVSFDAVQPAVASPPPPHSIVVLGSNGKTGAQIVSILAEQGFHVQPTSYSVSSKNKWEGNVNVYAPIRADVTDPASLAEALSGAEAVVFAASASNGGGNAEKVDFIGVDNVAKACVSLKVPRLVVISSGAVTRPDSLGFKITNIFGGIMDFKRRGEDALRVDYAEAGDELGYAIMRPGGLVDKKAVGPIEIELNQGDTIAGEISRQDLAQSVAAAATSKTIPSRVTFELSEIGSTGTLEGKFPKTSGYERRGNTYDEMFKGLTPLLNKL